MRTIIIALQEQVPKARKVKFLPDLSSADDTLVLRQYYTVTTDVDGTGTIDLPVKASGTIRYRYEIPGATGVSKGSFYLSAGADIELDDLIAAGGAATETVTDYIDARIAEQADLILALGSGVACIPIVCSDRITPIPIATNIMSRIMALPFQLLDVVAYLADKATTGTFTVDIKLDGVSVLSTLLTIDANEQSSITAAVPVVLGTVDFPRGSEITVDVTDDADGTASGLVVELIGIYVPPDTTDPTVPASITATTVSASEIDLDWPAATDDTAVSGYTLQRATNAGFTTGVTNIVLGNVLTYSDTGLSGATEYWYRVKARDAAGNESAFSSSDNATTSGFAPTDISGLVLWLKASAITGLSDGDPVTTWQDGSPANNDVTQATAGNKPTYQTNEINGLPIVRFDGVDDYLTTQALAAVPAVTVFFVVKSANAADSYMLSLGSTTNAIIQEFGAGLWEYFNTPRTTIGNTSTSLFQVLGTNVGSSFSESWTVGAAPGGTAENWAGDVAEIIVYDSALSGGDQTSVTSYLSATYGL